MSEFGEPWSGNVVQSVDDSAFAIMLESLSHGRVKLSFTRGLLDDDQMQLLRDRLVACINACAGIPTESLDRARQFMPTLAGNFTPEQKAKLLDDLSKAGPGEVVSLPDQVEYSAALLKWRKEPPDKPGYYWVRFSADGDHGPSDLVEVAENEADGILYFHR